MSALETALEWPRFCYSSKFTSSFYNYFYLHYLILIYILMIFLLLEFSKSIFFHFIIFFGFQTFYIQVNQPNFNFCTSWQRNIMKSIIYQLICNTNFVIRLPPNPQNQIELFFCFVLFKQLRFSKIPTTSWTSTLATSSTLTSRRRSGETLPNQNDNNNINNNNNNKRNMRKEAI